MDAVLGRPITARIEAEVQSDGDRVGFLEIVVRSETVEVWFGHQRCAHLDRTLLREWLRPDAYPLQSGGVTWFRQGDSIALALMDAASPLALPCEITAALRACV